MITIDISSDITEAMRLARILASFEKTRLPKEIRASTKRMERFSKRLLRTGSRTGIKYAGQRYQSSARGEPPRSQSGGLARSIKSSFIGKSVGVYEGIVGALSPRGLWLEDGAVRRNSILEPRPFLAPTLDHEFPIIAKSIIKALDGEIV